MNQSWKIFKRWARDFWCQLPGALFEGFRKARVKGVWLGFCEFAIRAWPFPVTMGGLRLVKFAEATNYYDNFIRGELQDELVEKELRGSGGNVIEVGVNVGVTTRWWLTLHPSVKVTGVDMMEEAIAYTTDVVARRGDDSRWKGLVAAVGPEAGEVEVRFSNPLEGTNQLGASGPQVRRIRMATLDELFPEPEAVTLLKIDIEGAGGGALEGAIRLLSMVRHVVVEIHGEDETITSSRHLQAAGFVLRRFSLRSMWWIKQ